ncbi:MAG: hypothetical protein GC164_09835 [Phycisphaera sp.]|nr:hypothetical protein [Phycisphaera sp.]
MSRLTRTALAAATLLALTACAGPPAWSDDNQLLEPQRDGVLVRTIPSPIPDAGMPVGFVVVRNKSRAYASSGVRYIEHTYQGQAGLGDVADFYRNSLPKDGWAIVSQRAQTDKAFGLTATKGSEQIDLMLTKGSSVVTVWLRIMNPAYGDFEARSQAPGSPASVP